MGLQLYLTGQRFSSIVELRRVLIPSSFSLLLFFPLFFFLIYLAFETLVSFKFEIRVWGYKHKNINTFYLAGNWASAKSYINSLELI